MIGGTLHYISLPIMGLSPMPPELEELVVIKGPLGALPPSLFWILANTFYWLFWLNFMIGATNALAMLPLDGGHIFNDLVVKLGLTVAPNKPKKKVEKIAKRVTIVMSLINLFLIIWLVIGPHVAAFFRSLVGG
jgi:membrane-associated protease RseP (regulator of RpoE activity)